MGVRLSGVVCRYVRRESKLLVVEYLVGFRSLVMNASGLVRESSIVDC
jgi:hypothetical protein